MGRTKRWSGWIGGCAVLALLTGCDEWPWETGSDPSIPTDDAPEYVDTVFGLAEVIDADALEELESSSDVFEADPDEFETSRRDLEASVAEAEQIIEAYLQAYPELTDTLRPELGVPYVRNVAFDGEAVVLQGDVWTRLSVAKSIEVLSDADHQARILDDLASLVPDHCRDALPPEAQWTELDAASLIEARSQLVRCWRVWRDREPLPDLPLPLDMADPGFENTWTVRTCDPNAPDTDGPGRGNDGWADVQPTLHGMDQWRYRGALPPVRNQAGRGTCAAFAIASAMEWTLRRRLDSFVDVSEQGLYAVAKRDLFNSPYGDGLPTNHTILRLADENRTFPIEDTWGYNPSTCRERNDTLEQYRQSCTHYGNRYCGETTHQMLPFVVNDKTLLARPSNPKTNLEIADALDILVHHQGTDSIDAMQIYLEGGFGVVAALNWPDNSWGMTWGVGEASALFDNLSGGHAVHVVRVVEDDDVPGGGWVVLKNSWSASWGDNGYGYLPIRDFQSSLKTITALDVTSVRNTPPTIEIPQDGAQFAQTPLGLTLDAIVDDAEEGPRCCRVTWSENGQEIGSGPVLVYQPNHPGSHHITASVRDPFGATAQATARIHTYVNDSPNVLISRPPRTSGNYAVVPAGGFVAFSGDVSDPDETLSCDAYRWTLDGTDVEIGCTAQWFFAVAGTHDVTLSVEDSAGTVAEDQIQIVVEPFEADDAPYAQIIEPRDGELRLWNETIESFAMARPLSLAGHIVRWTLDIGDVEVPLGEGSSFEWRPETVAELSPGANDVTLRATYEYHDQTAIDEIDLVLQMPFQ